MEKIETDEFSDCVNIVSVKCQSKFINYFNKKNLISIILSYGELDINSDPFKECKNLESATLPDYYEREVVLPDSLCGIEPDILFLNSDTCYFFLIKYEDAKNNSWDEIRAKKLYKKWITVRNKEGEFDTNIKYTEENE
jgi:hypothetical protein